MPLKKYPSLLNSTCSNSLFSLVISVTVVLSCMSVECWSTLTCFYVSFRWNFSVGQNEVSYAKRVSDTEYDRTRWLTVEKSNTNANVNDDSQSRFNPRENLSPPLPCDDIGDEYCDIQSRLMLFFYCIGSKTVNGMSKRFAGAEFAVYQMCIRVFQQELSNIRNSSNYRVETFGVLAANLLTNSITNL